MKKHSQLCSLCPLNKMAVDLTVIYFVVTGVYYVITHDIMWELLFLPSSPRLFYILCLFCTLWETAMSELQRNLLVRWAPRPSCTSVPSGKLLRAAVSAADDQSTPPSPIARGSDQPSVVPALQVRSHSRHRHHVPEVHQHPVWGHRRGRSWRHGPARLRWQRGGRWVDLGELPRWVNLSFPTPTHINWKKLCNTHWMLHKS